MCWEKVDLRRSILIEKIYGIRFFNNLWRQLDIHFRTFPDSDAVGEIFLCPDGSNCFPTLFYWDSGNLSIYNGNTIQGDVPEQEIQEIASRVGTKVDVMLDKKGAVGAW